ncbi:MAG: PAS domain S-box-containing protein [Ascidiaceihabitans sp.]|jgi:PAS domain S-box-containing protein
MSDFTQQMALAFDAAPIGMAVSNHRVLSVCNTLFAEMLGYQRNDLVGQSFRILYPSHAEFDRVRDIGLKMMEEHGSYSDERMMQRKDGVPVWCRFRARTLTPSDPLAHLVMSFAQIRDQVDGAQLTKREREVLSWLSRGQTSKEIGRELGLSPRTIEDVRARLLRKFEVKNTSELLSRMSYARPRG